MKTGVSRWRWFMGRSFAFLLLALVILGNSWSAAAQVPLPLKPSMATAASTEDALRTRSDVFVPGDPVYLYLPLAFSAYGHDVLVAESFESAVMPPAGWDLIPINPAYTWEIWPFVPPFPPPTYPAAYDGSYSAACNTAGLDQDEVLLSPSFKSATAHLQFYSFGDDSFWYDHSLNVWLVVGEWDGVDDLLVHTANDDWIVDPNFYYIWSLSALDLTPYLHEDTPVRIAFQYEAGNDGDLVGLDAVLITR